MTDEARVEAFLEKFVTDAAGAATVVMTVIGDRLGFYSALTGRGPTSAEDLAEATGTHPRLVREWLSQQVASGYITYEPDAGTFEFPDEHAEVFVRTSPANVVGAAEIIAAQYLSLDSLERAFRGDGGIDYGTHHSCLFRGVERFFRTAYEHELASVWFAAVDGLPERLAAGATVADVGCGHGVSTLVMGREWPQSKFTGFDIHEPSIATARRYANDEPSVSNVSFAVAAADGVPHGPYDVVVIFDSLHDMGDPPAVLRHLHSVLSDDGILVVVEPWSVDRLEDTIDNPAARIDYSASTSLCTPSSLSQPGAYGLGTLGGPTRRVQLLTEAGFRDAALAADTGTNLVLSARR